MPLRQTGDTPRTERCSYNCSAILRKPSSHRLGSGLGLCAHATSAEDKQHDKRQGGSQRAAADEETREAKAAGIEALELRSQE